LEGVIPPKLKQAKKSGNVVKTISTTTAKDRIELKTLEKPIVPFFIRRKKKQ
jgi:hypothetical protein